MYGSNVYKCYSYCTGWWYANTPVNAPTREQRYTVTPNPSTATAQEFDPDDDNFGFNETTSFFEDAKNYNPVTGQDE